MIHFSPQLLTTEISNYIKFIICIIFINFNKKRKEGKIMEKWMVSENKAIQNTKNFSV